MSRVALGDIEKYQGNSRGFFSLRDDGDVASVRFLYETEDDVDVLSVHRINVNGQDRYVNCLRDNPDDPESKCPLCAAGNGRTVRLFLQIAEVTKFDDKTKDDIGWEAKIWDRGPQFVKKLQSICNRYNPLCGTMFEIERQGKKGDSNTDYGVFPIKTDGLKITELPERKDVLGTVVLDKSFEDLDAYVLTGQFPDEESEKEPVTRRGRSQEEPVRSRGRAQTREVPAEQEDDDYDDCPFDKGSSEGRRRSEPQRESTEQPARRRL